MLEITGDEIAQLNDSDLITILFKGPYKPINISGIFEV
ncbi:hypothetical protein C1A50_2584 [Paenibacillus polymyxa]|nr:hypothetical protein C1A50_2584 [Paenibacillus polymyxa]